MRDQTAAHQRDRSRYGFPRSKKKGAARRSFQMMLTAGVKTVLEVNRWNDFKKVLNVCFRFRSVVGQSKMFLRSKIDHGSEEVSDLV